MCLLLSTVRNFDTPLDVDKVGYKIFARVDKGVIPRFYAKGNYPLPEDVWIKATDIWPANSSVNQALGYTVGWHIYRDLEAAKAEVAGFNAHVFILAVRKVRFRKVTARGKEGSDSSLLRVAVAQEMMILPGEL